MPLATPPHRVDAFGCNGNYIPLDLTSFEYHMPGKQLLDLPLEVLQRICLAVEDPLGTNGHTLIYECPVDAEFPTYWNYCERTEGYRNLRSLSMTCWTLHKLVFPIMRSHYRMWDISALDRILKASWHSSVMYLSSLHLTFYGALTARSIAFGMDMFHSSQQPFTSNTEVAGRRSHWKEAELLVSLFSKLTNLRHLSIAGDVTDFPTLYLVVKDLVQSPLAKQLQSFQWMPNTDYGYDFDEPFMEESTAVIVEPFLPLLRVASSLRLLALSLDYLEVSASALPEVFQALSERPEGSSLVSVRIDGSSPDECPFETRLPTDYPAIQELSLSSYYASIETDEQKEALVDAVGRFPNLRVLRFPKQYDVDEGGEDIPCDFLAKLTQSAPKLCALGYGIRDEETEWWSVWRREKVRDHVSTRLYVLDNYISSESERVDIAVMGDGHFEILSAEMDEWEKTQARG